MIKRMKRTALTLLFALALLPLPAQEVGAQQLPDTAFVFRFVPRNDVFYVPFRHNEAQLNRLCTLLRANLHRLSAGQMYISVSSYATSAGRGLNPQRMAYLRSSRVKSELILRAGITEQMFVTDRQIDAPYADSLHNVVVVAFPASVEKIEQLAGAKAAETVRTYYREIETQQKAVIEEQKQREEAAREAIRLREAENTRRQAAQEEEQRKANHQRQLLEAQEQARLAAQAAAKSATPHALALRANLLRWATLTPDLGVEWRISRNWNIAVDGTWTSWSWDNNNRRYALWQVSPALHYYIGKQKRAYVGAMYHLGQFHYKLSATGKQGDLQGGGILGGYRLPIGKCLMLDFNLGFGCTHANYEQYTMTDRVRVRQGNEATNYWGVNKAGVTLVWKLF